MVARLSLESLCARSGSSAAERDSLQYFFFSRAAQLQDLQEYPFCSGDALEGLSMPFLLFTYFQHLVVDTELAHQTTVPVPR